jgi:hypothetical protein
MPITRLLQNASFGPDEIKVLEPIQEVVESDESDVIPLGA